MSQSTRAEKVVPVHFGEGSDFQNPTWRNICKPNPITRQDLTNNLKRSARFELGLPANIDTYIMDIKVVWVGDLPYGRPPSTLHDADDDAVRDTLELMAWRGWRDYLKVKYWVEHVPAASEEVEGPAGLEY
jgi:hypothetical protein